MRLRRTAMSGHCVGPLCRAVMSGRWERLDAGARAGAVSDVGMDVRFWQTLRLTEATAPRAFDDAAAAVSELPDDLGV